MGRCIRIDHRLPGRAQIEQLADEGVSLIVSDIDGTLTDGHEGSVCPEAIDMSRAVQDVDMQLALVSNNTNQRFVAGVASQLGVPLDLALYPRRPRDWKPLPTMVGRAVRETEASKDRTLVIGDGVTDMLAAVLAWVRRGHVVLRDPAEAGGYPLRSEVRAAVHFLGRAAMPRLLQQGFAKRSAA